MSRNEPDDEYTTLYVGLAIAGILIAVVVGSMFCSYIAPDLYLEVQLHFRRQQNYNSPAPGPTEAVRALWSLWYNS